MLIQIKLTQSKTIKDGWKNILSIHDSADFRAIENILVSLVHSRTHVSPIFTNGSRSDPPSPLHESSAEIMTPKGSTKPHNKPTNLVPYVPADPDSDPILSDSSSSESFDPSDCEYYKQILCGKRTKKNA